MLHKILPDKEKAKSILKLVSEREKFVSSIDNEKFSTILAENYYEIVKELATALLLLDGFRAIGENAHKETIDNLSKYKEFSDSEISILQDLRIKRNKSSYEGKPIDPSYIANKKDFLLEIINKLKKIVEKGCVEEDED